MVVMNSTWLDAKTPQQLQNGLLMFEVVASMGIFPLALNLITLYRDKGHLDAFIFGTSVLAILLACAPFLALNVGQRMLGKLRETGLGSAECGNLNPLRYCWDASSAMNYGRGLAGSDEKLFRVMAAFLLLTLGIYSIVHRIFLYSCYEIPRTGWRDQVRQALSLFSLGIELTALGATFSTLSALVKIVRSQYLSEWLIGQFLAVAIWSPFFIDFLYLLSRKCCGSCVKIYGAKSLTSF